MLRPLLTITCLLAASSAAAEPQRLTSEALKEAVGGSVIELDTPIRTRIPMRFGKDGLVSGEAGMLAGFLGAAKDRGRWWVANDKLCIKWFRWFNSEPRCMEIRAEGDRIHWRQDDGDTGTATLTERAPKAVAEARPAPAVRKPAAAALPAEAAAAPAAPAPQAADLPTLNKASVTGLGGPSTAEPETVPEAKVQAPASPQSKPPVAELRPAAPALALAAKLPVPVAKAPAAAPTPKTTAPAKAGARPDTAAAKKPPARAVETASLPSFRVARVNDDDMLNVRQGPSEEHPAVGVIPSRGRGVKQVGACVEDWCPVRHGGVTGWVNRFYLAAE